MRFDKELEKELEKLTETHLEALRKAIIERLAEQGLDNSGIAGASLEIEDNELTGIFYLYYLDQGRGPGKLPPVDSIKEWVQSKLSITDEEADNVAFAIAFKISEEGTEIKKDRGNGLLLEEMIEPMMKSLDKALPDFLSSIVLKFVS